MIGRFAAGAQAAVAEPARCRVLLIATDVLNHGGIQRFNRTLIAALRRLDVRLDVLSLNDLPGARPGSEEIHDATVVGFGRNKLAFASALVHALATCRYDALLVGHIHFARMVAIACRLPGLAVPPRRILIAHGLEVWDSVHGGTRRALTAFTDILSVSSYTRDMLCEQAPELARRRLHVFPNALAEIWVRRAEESRPRLPAAAATRARPYFLSVTRIGSNERTKGIVTTLEAFASLGEAGLDYVIAGRGDDVGFLRAYAQRLGLAGRVRFVGAVGDAALADLYRECRAFVLPSGQEGFGIVYLEAMYFGAPVVAARAKGVTDVVADETTGLLVEFGDVVALSRCLQRVANDAALRDRLRSNGLRQVTGDGPFTFDAFVARVAQILGLSPPRRADAPLGAVRTAAIAAEA